MSEAKGLENAVHFTLSTIGVDSIYRSQGKIPESFLRGVGLSEEFIRYIPSLVSAEATIAEKGIEFYSCFISYSHKDEEFAQQLFARMRAANIRVWYAPEEIKGGQKIHEQIEAAIRVYDKLLLVLSEASMASEWVKTEIRNARRQEKKTGKRKLFPVRLVDFETISEWSEFDADSGKDLSVELREYFIPDFSQWKDLDRFEVEVQKLLRNLKMDAPAVFAETPGVSKKALSDQAMSVLKIIEQTGSTRAVMMRNGRAFGLLPGGGTFGFSEEPQFIHEDMEMLVTSGFLRLVDHNGAGDPTSSLRRRTTASLLINNSAVSKNSQ